MPVPQFDCGDPAFSGLRRVARNPEFIEQRRIEDSGIAIIRNYFPVRCGLVEFIARG
jgi:hypothetical protein